QFYIAVDEQAALDALDICAERWDKKYPKISQCWRDNWGGLSTYFKYSQEVRQLIYTTNTIEEFNRQLFNETTFKSVFTTDDSMLKMLHLTMMILPKSGPGCQGYMNGFTTLDISSRRRYIVDKAAADKPLPPHIILLYSLLLRNVYTEFGMVSFSYGLMS